MIYSKAGPLLVAINPFKDIQQYGIEYITAYRQKLVDSPHVYATADAAYNTLMRDEENQSIILSGESGAGKTEVAKRVMQYLVSVGGDRNGVQSQVWQTNCILESFGNAKTSINYNSSRFGKLIKIDFSEAGIISGATIQTFLLEKSRVFQLVQGERSYHIFYQLCSGAPSEIRDKLQLKKAKNYYDLNQSNCLTIHETDDADGFHKLMEALYSLKISKEDQEHIFTMIAAILWLGNISFQVLDNENHIEVVDDEAIKNAASLLGCDASDLMLALSTHKIQVGQNKVVKRSALQQAIGARDALAKLIYSLKKNGFEELCINYANERLQQHFIRHLFKLEQKEYELDGIDFIKVDFVDNQECLDLFEKKPFGLMSLLDEESKVPKAINLTFANKKLPLVEKPVGLMSLLDEESKVPNATDLTFANKLRQHLSSNSCFRGVKGGAFGVLHSVGEVLYDTNGFLEKNRDPLHAETIQLLKLCKGQLPRAFASKLGSQSHNQSVASEFKGQLFKLVQQLETTTPHFIRCIKPNSKKVPGLYENEAVLEQLRSCGVLELVKIARSGYPTRLSHQEFTRRYGFLFPEDFTCQDPFTTSVAILQQFDILPEMYQVGYKRLYFRAFQVST
ncbi:actin binding motor protein [Lithospermum erythrorhizon]|uniref:Actin binding motor protein n=1 Tax=Lithospermum erythrorhizon TaxID=34254 RepID=A0AAV3QTC2_LITER